MYIHWSAPLQMYWNELIYYDILKLNWTPANAKAIFDQHYCSFFQSAFSIAVLSPLGYKLL